ncbi:hypothetical protein O0I10_010362 [Lichtheimia ornata]|uniref:Uncharacterized protein n=1 Tax=Lichtheimia ornata TaxID=688661 RepID=A0AAD7UXN5_9FUNG|nr:uncharacterized protein O0I10_010362 [Lichtheimia ornata]KAJ8654026.1 hypothetical protein O0I10_010362 [Lichtheimia ornata]
MTSPTCTSSSAASSSHGVNLCEHPVVDAMLENQGEPTTLMAIKHALAHFGIAASFDLDSNLPSALHDGNGTSACPLAPQEESFPSATIFMLPDLGPDEVEPVCIGPLDTSVPVKKARTMEPEKEGDKVKKFKMYMRKLEPVSEVHVDTHRLLDFTLFRDIYLHSGMLNGRLPTMRYDDIWPVVKHKHPLSIHTATFFDVCCDFGGQASYHQGLWKAHCKGI